MSAGLQLLSLTFGLERKVIKEALTHSGFYPDNNNGLRGNSRLVFAGMYSFKGMVAHILYDYYPLGGTQLQHILGNLFRNEYLERLFDKWGLRKWVRSGANFDVQKQKHIFVYAIMGAISQSNEYVQRRFIFRYIICDETRHVFEHQVKNRNIVLQLRHLAAQVLGQGTMVKTEIIADGMFCTTVMASSGAELSCESSRSYRYSRKKAIKNALAILSQTDYNRFVQETDYLDRLKQRESAKKQARTEELLQKKTQKDILRAQRMEKLKLIKKARDLQRKNVHAEAKKRKAAIELAKKLKEQKSQQPISANKRRFLEDKKK